jgi:hypothetical protein
MPLNKLIFFMFSENISFDFNPNSTEVQEVRKLLVSIRF